MTKGTKNDFDLACEFYDKIESKYIKPKAKTKVLKIKIIDVINNFTNR